MASKERGRGEERNEALKEFKRDFVPPHTVGLPLPTDVRIANAVEYAAYQLGQINDNLARLIDHLAHKKS
jgi:hypothetical protein